MMNRKKAGMLSVVGLSAALIAGVATNAMADTTSAQPKAQVTKPNNEQIAESMAADMAKKLDLNASTQKKVATLFKEDGKDIRQLQVKLSENRHELNALSPNDKGYMKDVSKLADQSADITKKLTIQYAKSRADLYALLTPKQVDKLENYGKKSHKAS